MPHIHDKIDFTVEVLVVCKGKVLLRKHDKYKIWLSVGGHIELDEDPNEAAIREVKEEVGLDVELFNLNPVNIPVDGSHKQLIPPVALNRHRISDTHEHIAMTFYARSLSDKVQESDNEKSGEWKWCTKEDIDQLNPIAKDVAFFAKRALDEVK
jgi:8-oxo-dGTP pyrophosphatase MutT (NUDIX family)